MRTCSNCGATVREGAKFCTSCGTRLNDTDGASQHDTWSGSANDAAASEQTAPSGTDATTGEEVAATTSSPTSGAEGFSWTWDSASTGAQASDEEQPAQVDEESGTVLDEAAAPDDEATTIADATEVEILEDEPTASEEPLAVPVDVTVTEPDTDTLETDEGDATLAAWAGQWSEEDGDKVTPLQSSAAASDEPAEVTASVADDAEEATVEKAERLLSELRLIIPALARPRPIDPNARAEGDTVQVGGSQSLPDLAAELDDARSSEQFDDLRETLETARQNPRDVDTMLSLANQTERLLALLDDRDRMASKLEALSARLREGAAGEGGNESDDDSNGEQEGGINLQKVL